MGLRQESSERSALHATGRSPGPPVRLVIFLAVAAAIVVPTPTRAAPPCRLTINGTLAFGTYDVFATSPLNTSVLVQLQCPASPAPTVQISKGSSLTYTPRKLASGTATLSYNVFLDPGFSQIWGDGTGGTYVWAPTKGNAQITAWAQIQAGQDVAAGSYTDTLVVTVFP